MQEQLGSYWPLRTTDQELVCPVCGSLVGAFEKQKHVKWHLDKEAEHEAQNTDSEVVQKVEKYIDHSPWD